MKQQEIIDSIKKTIDKARIEDRYSLFEFDCIKKVLQDENNLKNKSNNIYEIVREWDEISNIQYNTGVLLNEFIEDPKVVLAMHRTKFDYEEINNYKHNNDLENIMCNGLYNNGHANAVGGAVQVGIPDVSLTMTPINGLSGIINLISRYRGSNTTVIAVLDKEYVTDDLEIKPNMENKIYDYHNGFYYIKPKYIVGAIIKDIENYDTFYLRDEILENRYKLDNDKKVHL